MSQDKGKLGQLQMGGLTPDEDAAFGVADRTSFLHLGKCDAFPRHNRARTAYLKYQYLAKGGFFSHSR